MKTFFIAAMTGVYVLAACATYSADRERGQRNCWEAEKPNGVASSIYVAAIWPIYTLVTGLTVAMIASPDFKLCTGSRFK